MYEEQEFYPEDLDLVSKDDIPDLDFIKTMLVDLTCSVYKTGDIDVLENSLEEILACFNLDLPNISPKIQRKPTARRTVFKTNQLLAQ